MRTLEHVPKKLLDFFNKDMLQLFEFERFLFDHVIPHVIGKRSKTFDHETVDRGRIRVERRGFGPLERLPYTWNCVIEKESLKFKEVQHVKLEKVGQVF